MNATEFIKQLPEKKARNLFFIYGEEGYLVSSCRVALMEALDIRLPEMNLTVLKEKTTGADIQNACLQAPCFAEYRGVVLEDMDVSDKALQFEKVLEVLPPETKLVILLNKKPDMRKGIYKTLQKSAVCAECSGLEGGDLLKWLVSAGKKESVTLSRQMAELLLEIVGSDMYALQNELNKLKYAGVAKPTAMDIHISAAGSTEYDIFRFHNHMMQSEFEQAFGIFEKVKRDRSALTGFLGLLVSKFSPMYMARQCINAGMSDRQAAERLSEATGMKSYPAQFAARDSRAFSLEQIQRALTTLEQLDMQIKTGGKLPEYRTAFLKIYAKI